MIEAVIFDLYGTLIGLERDSRPYLRLARKLCPERALAVARRSLLMETECLGDFAARLGFAPPPGIESLEAEMRWDLGTACLFDDVPDILAELRSQGLRLGLISNLATPYKEPFHRLGLAAHFDSTLFSCDAGIRKPDRDAFLGVATELKVHPVRAVMVGDSPSSDVEGAQAVGMNALLLRRSGEGAGHRSIRSLRDLPGELSAFAGRPR